MRNDARLTVAAEPLTAILWNASHAIAAGGLWRQPV